SAPSSTPRARTRGPSGSVLRLRLAWIHDEPLDDAAGHGRVRDRVDVVEGHASVRDVLGLLHDRRTDVAEVEAARRTGADPSRRPALDERRLEALDELFTSLLGARSLRVVVGAAVRADEE